jgi:hypothetical protein
MKRDRQGEEPNDEPLEDQLYGERLSRHVAALVSESMRCSGMAFHLGFSFRRPNAEERPWLESNPKDPTEN